MLDTVDGNADDFNVQQGTALRIGRTQILSRDERQIEMEHVQSVKLLAPRIEPAVHDVGSIPHERRLEHVAAATHLLEEGRVQVEGGVFRLVVECHHLNAEGPEEDRIEIGRVDPHSGRIRSQQLRLRVRQDRDGLLAAQFLGRRFVDGTAFEDRMAPFARRIGLR